MTVVVQDRLPVVRYVGVHVDAFTRPDSKYGIWLCLLEKAVASLKGNSYDNLNGGNPDDALMTLRGPAIMDIDLASQLPMHGGHEWIQMRSNCCSMLPWMATPGQ